MAVNNNRVVVIDFRFVFFEVADAETRATRHSHELWDFRVRVFFKGLRPSDFLKAVSCDIRTAIEGNVADCVLTVRPEVGEDFGGVEIIVIAAPKDLSIRGAVIEENDMVVRTAEAFAVFTTTKEAETGPGFITEPFHEVLVIREDETRGEVFFVIGKGQEAGALALVSAELMHTAERPLARSLELAADALAAGDLQRDACIRLTFVKDKPAR